MPGSPAHPAWGQVGTSNWQQHPTTGKWYQMGPNDVWGTHGPMSPVSPETQEIWNATAQQRAAEQRRWSDLGNLFVGQAGPALTALDQRNDLLAQMFGLQDANMAFDERWIAAQRGLLGQQAGLNNRGTQITLDDINRRRGFASRDLGISQEDISARRGFAGTERDLSHQLIDTDRDRLNRQRDMDRALLDSEQIARGAFGSNMANFKRGFIDDMLRMDLSDRDIMASQADLSFDRAMRNLLTEEQRAQLGYDSTMSGLLTAEQRALLDRQAGNIGIQRQLHDLTRQQEIGRRNAFTEQLDILLSMADSPIQEMNIMRDVMTNMMNAGIPESMIQEIIGDFFDSRTNPPVEQRGRPARGVY